MKRTLGFMAVVAGVGFWAGVSYGQSASVLENVQAGLAIVIGTNLFFCLWLWYRAEPGSGDAMVLPTLVLSSVLMLLGILPRVIWPAGGRLQVAGSIASIILSTVFVAVYVRRWRRLRRAARPA